MEISSFVLAFIAAILSAAIYILNSQLKYWQSRGIPHDKPHLLVGSMSGLRKTRSIKDITEQFYRKYKGTGPFVGFFFFQKPVALILDIQLVKNILIKDFSNFSSRGIYHNEKNDPLSGHLFALDSSKWKKLRNKLSPTFTSGKMKFMFPTVVSVGHQFVEVFREMLNDSFIVEVKELLARFTTDVIGTCAFGIECNSLKDPSAEFLKMGKRVFTDRRHGQLITAFMESFQDLARKLGFRVIHEDIHQFFMRIVRENVEYREKNNIERNDFMKMLIDLKNKRSVKTETGEDLTGLTMDEVAAQAFVFFIAGFETSSTTMGFVLYELALNQAIQDRLRTEVRTVLAKHNNELTYECMKQMHYMDQVISETLRMYTIVPILVRKAEKDYIVDSNPKYTIPKGVQVFIPSAAIHRDPEFYPNPNVFDPDRFSEDGTHKREPVTWLPFGEGPRNCIGMRFGQMQACIGLALLINNFKFSRSERTVVPIEYDLKTFPLLSSKGGIYLKVEKI